MIVIALGAIINLSVMTWGVDIGAVVALWIFLLYCKKLGAI